MTPTRFQFSSLRRSFLAFLLIGSSGLAPGARALAQQAQTTAAPGWTPQAAAQLRRALDDGHRHAIETAPLVKVLESSDARGLEAARTRAALAYADALAHGAVDAERVHDLFGLARNRVDLAAGLRDALARQQLDGWLAGLAPQDAEYRALSQAYLAEHDLASTPGIPAGPLLKSGRADPRVPAIAQALVRLGYMRAAPAGSVYTPSMAEAVRRLQADYGVAVDAVIGPKTLEALNKGPAERSRQLAVNLERRRWLTRTPPAERIDVNLAAGELRYLRQGRAVWTSKVIGGAPRTPTPLLEEDFEQLVVNPPWNVPSSIAQAEILPKGPEYLRTHNMYVENGRVVQRPGPDAALGLVKFDMQNRHAIYLHDTPAKTLFERPERFFSHGCVRVENAIEFARLLATESGRDAAFEAALASGETKVVPLGRRIPVRLMYQTIYLDQSGELAFRRDPYGLDEKLAQALGLGAGRAPQLSFQQDLGP